MTIYTSAWSIPFLVLYFLSVANLGDASRRTQRNNQKPKMDLDHITLRPELESITESVVEILSDLRTNARIDVNDAFLRCQLSTEEIQRSIFKKLLKKPQRFLQEQKCEPKQRLMQVTMTEWFDMARKIKQRTQQYSHPFLVALKYQDGFGIEKTMDAPSLPYPSIYVKHGTGVSIVAKVDNHAVVVSLPAESLALDMINHLAVETYIMFISMTANNGKVATNTVGITCQPFPRNARPILTNECNFEDQQQRWTYSNLQKIAEAIKIAIKNQVLNIKLTFYSEDARPNILPVEQALVDFAHFPNGVQVVLALSMGRYELNLKFNNVVHG